MAQPKFNTENSTPTKCKERRWRFHWHCHTSEVQGTALISGTGFSTPKKNKAQKWVSKDDLLRQRSAGSGPDFWHWIFNTREEKSTEIEVKDCLQHQRITRLKFSTENPTPKKCREWHWFLPLDFLRQRRKRHINRFQKSAATPVRLNAGNIINVETTDVSTTDF